MVSPTEVTSLAGRVTTPGHARRSAPLRPIPRKLSLWRKRGCQSGNTSPVFAKSGRRDSWLPMAWGSHRRGAGSASARRCRCLRGLLSLRDAKGRRHKLAQIEDTKLPDQHIGRHSGGAMQRLNETVGGTHRAISRAPPVSRSAPDLTMASRTSR